MRILVACECSGVVRRAFRAAGHDAWSCDFLPAEDGSPHHYEGDVRWPLKLESWDMLIGFPDCTYVCGSGIHWNNRGRGWEKTEEAVEFFRFLLGQDIPRIALENPVGILSTRIRPADQYVQPYEFGEDASKKTGLWLKGLPPLQPTRFIPPRYVCRCGYAFCYDAGKYGCANCNGEQGPARPRWSNQTDSGQNKLPPSADRWKDRARTYPGIAAAMAAQWTKQAHETAA